ncbi:MAG: hypothetical protein HY897_07425 [Deltaproteobacteria bacterium]|nr:hypothetical protein [Deltaproteobacteria bacterium]
MRLRIGLLAAALVLWLAACNVASSGDGGTGGRDGGEGVLADGASDDGGVDDGEGPLDAGLPQDAGGDAGSSEWCGPCEVTDPAELDVMSKAVQGLYGEHERIYVRGVTTWDEHYEPADRVPDASQETRDDVTAKNQGGRQYCLCGELSISPEYEILSVEDFEARKYMVWDAGSDAPALYFSRTGFNAARTEALVFTGYICGGLCAEGYYHLLKKSGGVWRVEKTYHLWSS